MTTLEKRSPPIRIKLRQEEIDAGIRWYRGFCPVALAIKRTGKFDDVAVDRSRIYAKKDGKETTYMVTIDLYDFIVHFDHTGKGKPFEFTLNEWPAPEADTEIIFPG